MGSFIKGIVVGAISFALGFAVLSVVIPVPPEHPASDEPQTAPTAAPYDLIPSAPVAPTTLGPLVPPVASEPDPTADAPEEPAATASATPAPMPTDQMTDSAAPAALAPEAPTDEVQPAEVQATETQASEALEIEAPMPEVPVSETLPTEAPATEAPATEVPATEVLPTETQAADAPTRDAPTTADLGTEPAPVASPSDATHPEAASATGPTATTRAVPGAPDTNLAASHDPDTGDRDTAPDAANPPVANVTPSEAPIPDAIPAAPTETATLPPFTEAGSAPDMAPTPAVTPDTPPPDTAAPDLAATETPALQSVATGMADVQPGADLQQSPAATPADTAVPPVQRRAEPVPSDRPANDQAAPEAAPIIPSQAIPAEAEPAPEPTAAPPRPSQTPPRVEIMPSGAPGVSVRRGAVATTSEPLTDRPSRVEGVTVGRLPTVGAAPEPDVQAADTPPSPDTGLPAYQRYAAHYTIEPGQHPLGLVLIDSPAAEAAILALPFQATLAIDPYDPDGPRRAAAYRRAGHEVALLAADVPALATASDIALTVQTWMQSFPETIALMDVPVNGIGARRSLAVDVAAMLAPGGYGAIALRGGLDAYLNAAQDAGLANASVYRVLDEGGVGLVTISRLLDRAAFEALRAEGILVVGAAANPETLEALTRFADGLGRSGVTLVPASAVLRAP